MNKVVDRLLKGQSENHLLPFFWQHGEDELTLRKYVHVIYESGCRAFCVESRPHPDFCGDKWWQDMDAILDEAEKLDMKVWILDDSHFPTGYCNGAVKDAAEELCRQGICSTRIKMHAGENQNIKLSEVFPPVYETVGFAKFIPGIDGGRVFADDRIISAVFVNQNGDTAVITDKINDDSLSYTPESDGELFIVGLTRNIGHHKDYMNMMSRTSCRLLIDAVYEPHYRHYADKFGKTIAGFFSDEPELGNGQMYWFLTDLGRDNDLPYSAELDCELKKRLGENYANKLYLLWADGEESRKIRFVFMDSMTKLIRENFSSQVGSWCAEHGVEYIGHLIEDANVHTKTGSGLGHYFRGIFGQHYAGLDIIGGQLLPGDFSVYEDDMNGLHDQEIYHFMIAQMAVSAALIDSKKHGRTMCECFGASGWDMTLRLQKFITDALLVRGVNYFTPHAFSPKAFPDPDCPPHFYAHGHNPLYRHFGKLMEYMNRVSELITGGEQMTEIAVLYPAEADWMGYAMRGQEIGRVLNEAQFDFSFIPADALTDESIYGTDLSNGLKINGHEFKLLIIPECACLPDELMDKLSKLSIKTIFVNRVPDSISGNKYDFISTEKDKLVDKINSCSINSVKIRPADKWVRTYRYRNDGEIFIITNENPDESSVWTGKIEFPTDADFVRYDAYENKLLSFDPESVEIRPLESLILVEGEATDKTETVFADCIEIKDFTRSLCTSVDYPDFENEEKITLPEELCELRPDFSGFARYEAEINLSEKPQVAELSITDAHEGVELFVNGESLGIKIVPPFDYRIEDYLSAGENKISIEVATTAEREVYELTKNKPADPFMGRKEPVSRSGITGKVYLKII